MKATCIRCYNRPSVLSVGMGRRLLTRLKLFLCGMLCVLAMQASAQNLVVNGDFETGQLAPWQGGEMVANPSGGLCARVGEPSIGYTLWQSVVTVPGQRYLLSGALRSEDQSGSVGTVIAQSQAGNIDGSR